MGRRPKCKSCVSYEPQPDGTILCEYSGKLIDPESAPMFDGGICYEKKTKQKLTPAQLSLVRSEAGRKGGLKNGSGNGRTPTTTITVRLLDYRVLVAYARELKVSIAEAIHRVSRSIVRSYPNTKPEGWVEDEQKTKV